MILIPFIFIFLIACGPSNVEEYPSAQNKSDTIILSKEMVKEKDVDTSIIILHLSHYQVPCVGEGVSLCYFAQEGEDLLEENWEYFYEAIEGFEGYQWGYNYQLKVKKTELVSPIPEDASSFEYQFIELVSKEKVAEETTFELEIKADEFSPSYLLQKPDSEDFYLLDTVKVNFAEEELKGDLETLIQGSKPIVGVFQHTGEFNTLLLKRLEEVE